MGEAQARPGPIGLSQVPSGIHRSTLKLAEEHTFIRALYQGTSLLAPRVPPVPRTWGPGIGVRLGFELKAESFDEQPSPEPHRRHLRSKLPSRTRVCYALSRGRRCRGKLAQTRRRTKTLAIPRRGRQRSMSQFNPQPEGLGPVFPISASVVANRCPICVAPHSLNSEKPAPSGAHAKVHNRL